MIESVVYACSEADVSNWVLTLLVRQIAAYVSIRILLNSSVVICKIYLFLVWIKIYKASFMSSRSYRCLQLVTALMTFLSNSKLQIYSHQELSHPTLSRRKQDSLRRIVQKYYPQSQLYNQTIASVVAVFISLSDASSMEKYRPFPFLFLSCFMSRKKLISAKTKKEVFL